MNREDLIQAMVDHHIPSKLESGYDYEFRLPKIGDEYWDVKCNKWRTSAFNYIYRKAVVRTPKPKPQYRSFEIDWKYGTNPVILIGNGTRLEARVAVFANGYRIFGFGHSEYKEGMGFSMFPIVGKRVQKYAYGVLEETD